MWTSELFFHGTGSLLVSSSRDCQRFSLTASVQEKTLISSGCPYSPTLVDCSFTRLNYLLMWVRSPAFKEYFFKIHILQFASGHYSIVCTRSNKIYTQLPRYPLVKLGASMRVHKRVTFDRNEFMP